MNKKLEFIQKNYGWLIAISTFGGILILNLLKFLEYLKSNLYFQHYGIDINLYEFEDKNVLYNLGLSIIMFLTILSVLYCFWQSYNKIKNKEKLNLDVLINILIIIIYNSLYIFKSGYISFKIFCFQFVILLIIEFFGSLMIFNPIFISEKKNEDLKKDFINYLKTLPFIVIILIFLISNCLYSSIIVIKNYRIIDDNKVIVYTSNNYYLTLDCKVNNDELTIYKGTQEKINNVNVYSKYTKFKKVHIIKS